MHTADNPVVPVSFYQYTFLCVLIFELYRNTDVFSSFQLADLPEHIQIAEVLVMPANQATGTIVSRK